MKKIAFLYLWNPESYQSGGGSIEIATLKHYLEKQGVRVDYHYIFNNAVFGPKNYLKKVLGVYRLFRLSKNLNGYDAIIGFDPLTKNPRIKTVRFFQGNDFRSTINNRSIGSFYRLFRVILDMLSLDRLDNIMSVSDSTAYDISKLYRCRKPVTVIRGGVDFGSFHPVRKVVKIALRKKLGIGDSEKVILSVGILAKGKGFDTLFRVAKRLPGLKFLIIGEGPLKSSLLRGHIKNVQLISKVPHQLIHKYFQLADIFVLLSKHEGFPMVLREATAAGLPVLCTDVGDCSLLVKNGFNGYLVPPSENQIVSILSQLAKTSQLRQSFSRNSRKMIRSYTWDRAARAFIKTIYGHQ